MTATRVPVSDVLRRLHEKLIVEERIVLPAVKRHLFVISAVLCVVGLSVFSVLLVNVLAKVGAYHLDAVAADFMDDGRSDILTGIMIGLAIVFGPVVLPIMVLVVTTVWGILAKHAWRPVLLAFGMLLGVVIHQFTVGVVGRARPPVTEMLYGADYTSSFPSGHVLGASDFVLIMTYLIFSRARRPKTAVVAFGVAAVLIVAAASSRLYLGYHWLTDALASVSLSLVVLGVIVAIDTYRTVRTRSRYSNLEM